MKFTNSDLKIVLVGIATTFIAQWLVYKFMDRNKSIDG